MLSGEIDFERISEVREAFADALAVAEGRLVELNLADVTFIDSSGLGALLDARTRCQALETKFVIADVPDRIRQVFVLTGLAVLLESLPEPPGA
jgi:anti-sigma B factor antagonist